METAIYILALVGLVTAPLSVFATVAAMAYQNEARDLRAEVKKLQALQTL